jgi:hypothetical protein
VERFEADQLERHVQFRAMLEQERLTFAETEHTALQRTEFRASLHQQQQAFWLSQSVLLKEFRASQLARRGAFEAWMRKHREILTVDRCGTAQNVPPAEQAESGF